MDGGNIPRGHKIVNFNEKGWKVIIKYDIITILTYLFINNERKAWCINQMANKNTRENTDIFASSRPNQNGGSGNKLKKVLGIIAGVLAVVIIVGLFTFTKLSDNGFFLRHNYSVKSENYQVNNAQMSYFFSTNYYSSVSANSSYYEYYGLDTSKTLKSQQYPGGGTWYDYFMQSVAVPAVKQMLTLCEAAKAEGYTLTEDDRNSVDTAIVGIEEAAAEKGYSVANYVMNNYGVGVKLKDVRAAMELNQLAYSYYNHLMESFTFTEEDWNTYYSENEDSFQRIDYLSYSFSLHDIAELYDTEDDDAAETTDATDAADTAAEEKHDHSEYVPVVEKYADELASKKSADDFAAYIETFLNDVLYASEEDEAARLESVQKDMKNVESTNVKYSEDDETLVKLFALGKGETYIEKDEENEEYTVYYITEPKYHEEYTTKNAYMIMLSGTSDEVTADLDEINKALSEDASAEKFAALAEEYSADSAAAANGALYENIGKTNFSSDEIVNWLFSDERKAGEYEVFAEDTSSTTTTSDTVYYYVIMYKDDGMVKWQYDADESLRSDAYSEKYKGFEEAYGGDKITADLKELYKIPN